MASSAVATQTQNAPETKKSEPTGESFYAKILDAERKKTNGEKDIDETELTPEEMERMAKDWIGKQINLKHDLQGGFGKITAAWHTKDGKTHVRLTPGTSEAGKKASDMIKRGEFTSVSAGWKVHQDKTNGKIVHKDTDHVALTNLPVYEGTVIYAMASGDQGITPDSNGVLRTRGGLAVLPVSERPDAAVLVNHIIGSTEASKDVPEPMEVPVPEEYRKPASATEGLWTSFFGSAMKYGEGKAGTKKEKKKRKSGKFKGAWYFKFCLKNSY